MSACQHSWAFLGPAPRAAAWDDKVRRLGAAADGEMRARFMALVDRLARKDCDAPNMLRCRNCGEVVSVACNSRDASVCSPCEYRYRKRVRAIARLPMLVAKDGSQLFVTLTAPGAKRHCIEHTYVDKTTGKVMPSVRCNFDELGHRECPCSSNALHSDDDIAEWNDGIGRRWNDFLTDLRRAVPKFEGVQYFRALEVQQRGALHIHALFRLKGKIVLTPREQEKILAIAMRLGFGHQLDIRAVETGDDKVRAANYVAKYVSKASSSDRDDKPVPALLPLVKDCECMPWEEDPDALHDIHQGEEIHNKDRLDYWRGLGIPEGEFLDAQVECHHPRVKRKRFRMRLWTTSRRWGMTMKLIIASQSAHRTGLKALSSALTNNGLALVYQHQDTPVPGDFIQV